MSAEPNPYAPPPEPNPARHIVAEGAPLEPISARFDATGGPPRGAWQLALGTERLYLFGPEGEPRRALTRGDVVEYTQLTPFSGRSVLNVRGAPGTFHVVLQPDAVAALRRWLEPVIDAHRARLLRTRFRAMLPIAAFVLVAALPVLGAGVDYLSLAYGVSLLAVAIASRYSSHRALFRADAAVWAILAVTNVARVALLGAPAWQLAFAFMAVVFVRGALRFYDFYAPLPPAAVALERAV